MPSEVPLAPEAREAPAEMAQYEAPPAPKRRRPLWQTTALLLSFGGVLLYAFWPRFDADSPEALQMLGTAIPFAAPSTASPTPPSRALPAAPPAEARIEAVVIAPVDFPLRAEATGHLAPWRRTEISVEQNGVIVARPVEEGRYVKAGALLLRMDDREQQIALAEAEAERMKTRAAYALALSQGSNEASTEGSTSDTLRLTTARSALRRASVAHQENQISASELREIRRRFEAAQVLSGSEREAVQAATTGLSQNEQRVERAELNLSRMRLTAPFAGRVADIAAEVGQRLGAGQRVLTLLDDHRMKVAVDVLEADLIRLREGAPARVRLPALGDALFTGQLFALNPDIDPQTGTGRVTVVLPNPERRLVAGLFAYVALETTRLPARLVVPAEAILVRQGRDLVFRVEDGRAAWVYVTLGARSGDYVEITEGLAPGDTVAVAGHAALAHDAPVVVTATRPAFVE